MQLPYIDKQPNQGAVGDSFSREKGRRRRRRESSAKIDKQTEYD